MLYNDYTITIAARQGPGYPVSAVAEGMGRASDVLPDPPDELTAQIARIEELPPGLEHGELLTAIGAGLLRWLTSHIEMHLRLAWDRAEQQKRGLRLRFSIDAPEINAWPWELLHDPERDFTFSTSITTPVVRYLDQSNHFGGFADVKTDLPLEMLVVLPQAPDLNLVKERAVIEQAVALLDPPLLMHVLDGTVTRARFADVLISGHYEIVHGSGHGGFVDGQGYIALHQPDDSLDFVDGQILARFVANCKMLKLVVLNVCSSGKVDEARAFQGLAPQLVRAGVPAVVAMQYPLTDDAAMAFAEEFYRRLCMGENAGRVDVAVTHARNLLAILYPDNRCFAAPVVYTRAPDGVIFALQDQTTAPVTSGNGKKVERAGGLSESLQASAAFEDDLALAERDLLESWRRALSQAAEDYQRHLSERNPEIQEAARQGLAVLRRRLNAVDTRLSASE